jgi:hypothetical protein
VKKLKVTPGIIAGLHTFGARINFNPHVNMLVTTGGMKKNGEWKTYDFVLFYVSGMRCEPQNASLTALRPDLDLRLER